MKIESRPEGFRLFVDTSLYSEDTVFKCFYWYGSSFDVSIERANAATLDVSLTWKTPPSDEGIVKELEAKIRRDLIDFKTRDIITKETQVIRELLIAKAFAHGDDTDP